MNRSFLQRLLACSQFLPHWCSHSVFPLKYLICFVKCFFNVEIFLLKGLGKSTDYSVTTLYVGTKESVYQFADTVYRKNLRVHSFGKLPAFRVDPSKLPGADVVAVSIAQPLVHRFMKKGFLVLPLISFELPLRRSLDQITQQLSRRRRRDLRKLEMHDYSWSVSRNEEEDFDFFYWKMYHPYVTQRFGKGTVLRSYARAKALYGDNGGIIFVNEGNMRAAGILFQIRGKALYALNLGIIDGNQELLQDLVGQAALFFLVKWAKTKDIATLNYGLTVPFLHDSVFQYKKEWGMNIDRPGSTSIFCTLRLNIMNKGTVSFFSENPFIFVDKGRLKGSVFVNHRVTKPELEQMSAKYLRLGLDSLVVVAFHDREPTADQPECTNLSDSLALPLLNTCIGLRQQGLEVNAFECHRDQRNHCLKHSKPEKKLQRNTDEPKQKAQIGILNLSTAGKTS